MNRERMSSSTMLFVWPNSHWKYLIMGQPKVEFSIWSRKDKNLHIDPTANTHRALLNVNCKEKNDWYVWFEITCKCKLIWNLKSLFANFLSLLHSNLYISLSLSLCAIFIWRYNSIPYIIHKRSLHIHFTCTHTHTDTPSRFYTLPLWVMPHDSSNDPHTLCYLNFHFSWTQGRPVNTHIADLKEFW